MKEEIFTYEEYKELPDYIRSDRFDEDYIEDLIKNMGANFALREI
jgi:hypothetical protein